MPCKTVTVNGPEPGNGDGGNGGNGDNGDNGGEQPDSGGPSTLVLAGIGVVGAAAASIISSDNDEEEGY